jgi:hypothetical protein
MYITFPEALLGKDQDATNIKDVKKIVEQMVDLKCQNAGGDPIGLKQINAKICSKGNEMLASEKKIQIEEMIDWAIGQLDKTSNSHSSEGCCLPKGKWMGQVKGQLDKAADEFENGHKLEVFAWIRRILANKCDLPTGKEFVQNLAKFWKELKEGRLFQQ